MIMYEGFKKLEELKKDVEELEGYLPKLKETKYKAFFNETLRIATKADSLIGFKYSLVLARMERAKGCLSEEVMKSLILYDKSILAMVEKDLAYEVVKEFLGTSKGKNTSEPQPQIA